jgi:ubiquinone/menaquinone biosynthesis C-methylase UbiE
MTQPTTLSTPIEYYDKAAPTYEDTSMNLKDIARHLLTLDPTPLGPDSLVLGNACGAGTVTGEILAQVPLGSQPKAILATDGSSRMIQVLNQKKAAATQWERVETHVMDPRDLHIFQDGMFTHIYMNFSFFFISYPEKAATEIYRTLAFKGTAFITTWALLGYVPRLQRAQHVVRADLPVWLGPVPQVWMQPDKLIEILKAGGFRTESIVINNHGVSMKFAEWTIDALINFYSEFGHNDDERLE